MMGDERSEKENGTAKHAKHAKGSGGHQDRTMR
jgi:hypothetical protein